MKRAPWLVILLVLGCGPVSPGVDAGRPVDGGLPDAGEVDAGEVDAGEVDGGAPDAGELDAGAPDAGEVDAGLPDAGELDGGLDAGFRMALDGGHGRVLGACGRVAPELTQFTPSYLEVHLDFGMDQFDDPQERPRLTPGAQQILMEGTAGGSSGISEAFAFEVLALCEGATFLKSETAIMYNPPTSKKTDILVAIDGKQVGVSVTRAVSFPADAGYPVDSQRTAFLTGKLNDIQVSSMNVVPPDNWVKQILVVMAFGDMHASTIHTIWDGLDPQVRADTILYVVVTDGDDLPIYF